MGLVWILDREEKGQRGRTGAAVGVGVSVCVCARVETAPASSQAVQCRALGPTDIPSVDT